MVKALRIHIFAEYTNQYLRNSKLHYGPSGLSVTDQLALDYVSDRSRMLFEVIFRHEMEITI